MLLQVECKKSGCLIFSIKTQLWSLQDRSFTEVHLTLGRYSFRPRSWNNYRRLTRAKFLRHGEVSLFRTVWTHTLVRMSFQGAFHLGGMMWRTTRTRDLLSDGLQHSLKWSQHSNFPTMTGRIPRTIGETESSKKLKNTRACSIFRMPVTPAPSFPSLSSTTEQSNGWRKRTWKWSTRPWLKTWAMSLTGIKFWTIKPRMDPRLISLILVSGKRFYQGFAT